MNFIDSQTLNNMEEYKFIVKEDMICPVTKVHCDDECCPVGAICNMKGFDEGNGIQDIINELKP